MTHAANITRNVGLCLVLLHALIAGCQEGSAEPEQAGTQTTDTTPAPQQAEPQTPASEDAPDDPASAVEEIRQGAENEVQQPDPEPGDNTLASIPGFTPTSPSSEADLRHTPALPVTANTPDDAPVLVKVTLIDITNGDETTLAPLAAYLSGDDASAMDREEVEGLFELIGHLREQGVVTMASDGGVLVKGGQSAKLIIKDALPSSIPGVDAARDTLEVALSPALTAPVGEGPDAERLVRLGFQFEMTREDSPWQIFATDLGLDVGARTRAAGTAVVRSGEMFFVVRRIASDSGEREVLALIRPQVMPQEFNK